MQRMLEILIIGILAVTLLANRNYTKRKYHKSYRLRAVRSSASSADLNALAINTALTSSIFADPTGRPYRLISYVGTWVFEDAGIVGSAVVGFAHGDYTVAEIKEAIEAAGSINVGNKVEQERANRLVRIVGTLSNSAGVVADLVLNDGRPIKTRLNWLIPIGQTFNMFVYNDGVAAFNTASFVKVNGTAYVKDL